MELLLNGRGSVAKKTYVYTRDSHESDQNTAVY